jgi:hypothetical protein
MAIALDGRCSLYALQHHLKFLSRSRDYQQMNVIRHDDEIAHVVSRAIVPENLGADNCDAIRVSQVTTPEAAIQAALDLTVEMFLKLVLHSRRQFSESYSPIASFSVVGDAPRLEPETFLLFPTEADWFWNGISQSEGNKVG